MPTSRATAAAVRLLVLAALVVGAPASGVGSFTASASVTSTPIQVYGSLSGETRFLTFYLAPSGQPTSTDLSTSI